MKTVGLRSVGWAVIKAEGSAFHKKARVGFLNFDAIGSMSDFAIFLPNLNKVINFFIIKLSTRYELKQYR